MTTRFKHRLQHGPVQIGMWLSVSSPNIAAVVQKTGYDWFLVDEDELSGQTARFDAIGSKGCQPIARILSQGSLDDCARLTMDWPLILPLRSAVQLIGNKDKFLTSARSSKGPRCLLGLVSSTTAIAEIGPIIATDTLDAVVINTAELAENMGLAGTPSCASVQAEIEKAARQLKEKGIPFGVVVFDPSLVTTHLEQGATFLAVGGDAILAVQSLTRAGHMAE